MIQALKELGDLSDYLDAEDGIKEFAAKGTGSCAAYGAAALPTILIDKPVTLVGMGDTISSLSLAGALVASKTRA